MTRYFFHVVNDAASTIDDEGVDLPNMEAVRRQAQKIIAEIIAEEIEAGRDTVQLALRVQTADGTQVANIRSKTNLIISENPFLA